MSKSYCELNMTISDLMTEKKGINGKYNDRT